MLQVPDWGSTLFYAHDGNKNVSEVFYYALGNGIAAHYDYAPFGAVTATGARALTNPFRFSSEFYDNSPSGSSTTTTATTTPRTEGGWDEITKST